MGTPKYTIEFYEDERGDAPVYRWLTEELDDPEVAVLGMAMRRYLQEMGADVVRTRFGRALGGGLYEFRLDDTVDEILNRLTLRRKPKLEGAGSRAMLLRVFFSVVGTKVVLLLSGYDKGRSPHKSRQQKEIRQARSRLAVWLARRT